MAWQESLVIPGSRFRSLKINFIYKTQAFILIKNPFQRAEQAGVLGFGFNNKAIVYLLCLTKVK
jgi:hypothetical protein